mgnify:CR=1 FL=1
MLGNDLGRLEAVGEEEASEVEELGAVEKGLDSRRLEVGGLERLSGSEDGAKGAAGKAFASSVSCSVDYKVGRGRTGRVR